MRTWRGRDAGRGISARHTKHRKQRHTWWSNTSSSRRYFLFFSLVLVLSFTRGSRGLSPALTNKSFRSTSSSGTADFWFISSSSSSPDPSLVTEGSDIGRNFISKVFFFLKREWGMLILLSCCLFCIHLSPGKFENQWGGAGPAMTPNRQTSYGKRYRTQSADDWRCV